MTSTERGFQILPPGEDRCVWMSAGIVAYQLCDHRYECDSCPLDAAMRMHSPSGPATDARQPSPVPGGLREDRRYSANHCWVRQERGDRLRVGLEPGLTANLPQPWELVFPQPGHQLTRGRACLWIVMDKATLAVLSPIDGRLVIVNQHAAEEPHILQAEPEDSGWLFEVARSATSGDTDTLMEAAEAAVAYGKDLRRFSKRQISDFGTHAVAGVITKAVQLMRHHFRISNVECREQLGDADLSLLCDENQIQQALVALFVNSVEAMPRGGVLAVSAGRDPSGNLVIRVADNGVGISHEDQKRIFEPFFSTKKEIKGVGLGLSVVHGIVERHGGTFAVSSEPGQGTEFVMTFPPTSSAYPRMEPASAAAEGLAVKAPPV